MEQKTTIEISTKTILKIFGIAILFWFLWAIRNILVSLFVVAILVAAFSPLVEKLYKKKVPRFLSVFLIYLILTFLFSMLVYLIVPPIVWQVREFTHNLPLFIQRIALISDQFQEYLPIFQKSLENVAQNLSKLTLNIWSATLTIFGGLVSFLTVLVLTFYILVGKEKIKGILISFVPEKQKEQVVRIFQKVGLKIGAWVRGQIILCLLIGLVSYIILAIFKVPYALILAVIAGVLEIVPNIGPILSGLVAILFALSISPFTALIVGISYLGVQQLESQILVPKIMGKAVGVSPVLVIVALLVGGKLFGVAGAILAIPVAAAIQVVVSEWRTSR